MVLTFFYYSLSLYSFNSIKTTKKHFEKYIGIFPGQSIKIKIKVSLKDITIQHSLPYKKLSYVESRYLSRFVNTVNSIQYPSPGH